MEKYINKLIRGFKRIFSKKYFAVVAVFTGIIAVLGFSYGYLSAESNWQLASELRIRNLYYSMTIGGNSMSSVSVAADSTTYYDVAITSLNDLNTRYSLTYKSSASGVTVAVSSSSANRQEGIIGLASGTTTDKTKTIRVAITNSNASSATVTFNVAGGYTWNPENEVAILSGYSRITNMINETSVSIGKTLAEEINTILNCTPTSSKACLYKHNANNYLTYAGQTWRIVGTYYMSSKYVVKLVLDSNYGALGTYSNRTTKLNTFYSSVMTNNSLVRTSSYFTCSGTTSISCTSGSANIGSISKAEYDAIGGVNSYLYTKPDENYWMQNSYYVGTSRGASNLTSSANAYTRPSIYLKPEVVNAHVGGEYGTKENPYEIVLGYSLTINGLTNATTNLSSGYYIPGQTYTLDNPTHSNSDYIFSMWSVSGTGASVNGTTFTMGTGNTTLTAIWGRKYEYSGSYGIYTASIGGYYYIEAYGAQGGDITTPRQNAPTTTFDGGKGGYTSGYIYLDVSDTIYFYVGGQGSATSQDANQTATGGYNGGGDCFNSGSTGRVATSGGGATDVRYFGSQLPSDSQLEWDSDIGLNSRIMVAGGGGGAFSCITCTGNFSGTGGAGGNLTGGSGSGQNSGGTIFTSLGGTQTGNIFGKGGSATIYQGVGGGGGYYGGDLDSYSGGGGSSFISGYAGSNAITSSSDRTHTGSPNHYSGYTFERGRMISGVRSGNGFAKIIYIGDSIPDYPLYTVMKTLATAGNYAATYSGSSNDTYGVTGSKTIYYTKPKTTSVVSNLLEAINVKFAGFCWQLLRTTDTGGVKLLYNGDPDSTTGYCKSVNTTDTHAAVTGVSSTTKDLSVTYKYADSFTYDSSGFHLVNAYDDNYATNKNLIGKYTCANTTGTCTGTSSSTYLYVIAGPNPSTVNSPYVARYSISTIINAHIGSSAFSGSNLSPAYVGYKYGMPNVRVGTAAPTNGDTIVGNDVSWTGTEYILKDGTNESNMEYYDTQSVANYRYTCHNTSSRCTEVYYYYYTNGSNNYYTKLSGGEKIEDALTRMLTANTYNSAIKSFIETWYENNLHGTIYEDYIDQNAVYCNDRSITSLLNYGGWSNSGLNTNQLKFNDNTNVTSLACANNTDKFSVGNSAAQLVYPIGLATFPEMYNINNATIRTTGNIYWPNGPSLMHTDATFRLRYTNASGSVSSSTSAAGAYGVRPVITLAPIGGVTLTGSGTLDDPYEIN